MPSSDRLRELLGPIGIWSFRLDAMSAAESATAAREIERLGFPALWIPEVGRTEAMSLAGHLLANTNQLVVANGIARVIDRSAGAAAAAHRHLQDASGGRHVLGLGLGGALSNGPKPIDIMTQYVDDVVKAWERHPAADGSEPTWCLAAYNDRMAELAGGRTGGVHTYLITPEHTGRIRSLVGAEAVIAAEAAVVLTSDRDEAVAAGRAHLGTYIGSRSHQRKFRALGFDDADFAEGGSDRLVEALVVYGDDAIRERIDAHRAAGADHVGIQVLGTASLDANLAAWSRVADLVMN